MLLQMYKCHMSFFYFFLSVASDTEIQMEILNYCIFKREYQNREIED